jgi:AmmeMemoRadiSam system protein B/AmmeMemoRadiSam system protein A
MVRLRYFSYFITLFLIIGCGKTVSKSRQEHVHKTILSDQWHTHDTEKLTHELNHYFSLAERYFPLSTINKSPAVALVVPHAAYFYSGLCAATAYQSLLKPTASSFGLGNRKNTTINRVIILAPCHTSFYQGAALPIYTAYQTPLGNISIDLESIKKLSKAPPFSLNGDVHEQEHGVEMQLPMLQYTIANFSIVPIVLGHLSQQQVMTVAHALLQVIDDKTLVVASSDFTHYGRNYSFQPFMKNIQHNIRQLDSFALQALNIPSREAFIHVLTETKATICGQEPLNVLLALLEAKPYEQVSPETTCYYTSAQISAARNDLNDSIAFDQLKKVASDKQSEQSVSYAGIVYHKAPPEAIGMPLNGYETTSLLAFARAVIEDHLQDRSYQPGLQFPIITPAMEQTPGVFVSLKGPQNNLRGCIGHVKTEQPLYKSVLDLSLAAAFGDKRFLPLAPGELAELRIEISMLSKPRLIKDPQEIILGKHGIILEKYDRLGTMIATALFLPSVARELKWTLTETLEELCIKANLPPDSWKDKCMFAVFETYEIKDHHE